MLDADRKYPLGFDTPSIRDGAIPGILARVNTPADAAYVARVLYVGEDIPEWLEEGALKATHNRIHRGLNPHALVDRFAPYFEFGMGDPHG